MVGGGIAALAAAVLPVRDRGVAGERVTILENRGAADGNQDGTGETGADDRTGQVPLPPPVARSDLDPRALLRAARVLLSGWTSARPRVRPLSHRPGWATHPLQGPTGCDTTTGLHP